MNIASQAELMCVGGPLNGQKVQLKAGTSMVVRMGEADECRYALEMFNRSGSRAMSELYLRAQDFPLAEVRSELLKGDVVLRRRRDRIFTWSKLRTPGGVRWTLHRFNQKFSLELSFEEISNSKGAAFFGLRRLRAYAKDSARFQLEAAYGVGNTAAPLNFARALF